MEEVPSREQLRKMKVVELRQSLSKLSLPQRGIVAASLHTSMRMPRFHAFICLQLKLTWHYTDLLNIYFAVGVKEELITRLIAHYEEVRLLKGVIRSP